MENKAISAEILKDSVNCWGDRITTFILTYPRFIHAELLTHRVFSRNSTSSKAIPFAKMIEMVENNPVIPIAFQKDHTGMQGTSYLRDGALNDAEHAWLLASKEAVKSAKVLSERGVTKQLCNRILEPFLWHTTLVTATAYDGFFALRCPRINHGGTPEKQYKSAKDWNVVDEDIKFDSLKFPTCMHTENISMAEIHIQDLAEKMWDIYNENTPILLQPGEWHIPFAPTNHDKNLIKLFNELSLSDSKESIEYDELQRRVGVARCARISYNNHDGEIDYAKDLELFEILRKNHHARPFEHIAKVMTSEEYESNFIQTMKNKNQGMSANFKGFIQLRQTLGI